MRSILEPVAMQLIYLITFSSCSLGESSKRQPDQISEQKALQIAEKKLVETYGKGVLEQKPFRISLDKDVWKISGTFHCPKSVVCKGGVAYIHISSKDGSVLYILHDK